MEIEKIEIVRFFSHSVSSQCLFYQFEQQTIKQRWVKKLNHTTIFHDSHTVLWLLMIKDELKKIFFLTVMFHASLLKVKYLFKSFNFFSYEMLVLSICFSFRFFYKQDGGWSLLSFITHTCGRLISVIIIKSLKSFLQRANIDKLLELKCCLTLTLIYSRFL